MSRVSVQTVQVLELFFYEIQVENLAAFPKQMTCTWNLRVPLQPERRDDPGPGPIPGRTGISRIQAIIKVC